MTRASDFEQYAAHLWQMADHLGTYEVIRAAADGRDAIGAYLIAPRLPGHGASLNGGYRSVTRTNA